MKNANRLQRLRYLEVPTINAVKSGILKLDAAIIESANAKWNEYLNERWPEEM